MTSHNDDMPNDSEHVPNNEEMPNPDENCDEDDLPGEEEENCEEEIVDITEENFKPGLKFQSKASAKTSLKKYFADNFHPCICVSKHKYTYM